MYVGVYLKRYKIEFFMTAQQYNVCERSGQRDVPRTPSLTHH
jgi:hypothetical protein